AKRFDLVDRASPSEERTIGLIETRIAACFFVDLNFESRMYRHKSGVIRRVDRIRRRVGQPWIAKAEADARIVIGTAAGMRKQESETQDKVLKWLRHVEQQAEAAIILLRDHRASKPRETPEAGHLPVRELRIAAVE